MGYSLGAAIASEGARRLEVDLPDPPPSGQVEFVIIADPLRPGGLVHSVLQPGTRVPILDLHVPSPPETPYNEVVVIQEYDGFAHWPDEPNILAVANGVMGTGLLGLGLLPSAHKAALTADLDSVPPENITVEVNARGGTTTTYLVKTHNLPLTDPLRAIGVPDPLVDAIDERLRPIVDSGYSHNDDDATDVTSTDAVPNRQRMPTRVVADTSDDPDDEQTTPARRTQSDTLSLLGPATSGSSRTPGGQRQPLLSERSADLGSVPAEGPAVSGGGSSAGDRRGRVESAAREIKRLPPARINARISSPPSTAGSPGSARQFRITHPKRSAGFPSRSGRALSHTP